MWHIGGGTAGEKEKENDCSLSSARILTPV